MLRITQSKSSAAAKNYFEGSLRRGDYYMDGLEIPGHWGGKTALMLGLDGPVHEDDFCAMLENVRPDGRRLTTRTVSNRRPGYDFTFDVPKSVSLLYAIGGDERIVEAMNAASNGTMLDIEKEMHTRVRRNRAQEDRITGNMAYACFPHVTSRPTPVEPGNPDSPLIPDPHLHVHVYAINATWDPEEHRMKAGVFMQAKRDATYFQAAYHARLAAELQKIGYDIDATAKAFEVRGVSRELIETFSRRTKEVEETAAKLGITNAKAKDKLGAKTRRAKNKHLSAGQLHRVWERMAGPEDTERLKDLVVFAKEDSESRAVDITMHAREAVDYAIDKEFERASEVSERRVLASALEKAVGRAGVESVHAALASREDVLYAVVDGEKRVTTMQILHEEDRLLRQIRTRNGTVLPIYREAYSFKNKLFTKASAHEQRVAIEAFMSSRNWVFGLIGRAGTGKTTLLKEIKEGLKAKKIDMLAVAPTAEAARGVLREEGFTTADTVKRLLVDRNLQQALRGNVLWIDEAGMLGNQDLLDLLSVASKNGARRVVLAGDPTQIRSVPRGDALHFLEERAGLQVARLTTILRQKNPTLKKAVEAISKAEMRTGLSLLDEDKCVVEAPAKEAHDALAKAYVERVTARKSTLVVCPTHAEGRQITTKIRKELQKNGKLCEQERLLPRLVPQNWTAPEKSRAASYEVGMIVEFRRKTKGFEKRERVKVVEVNGRSESVEVCRENGGRVRLPLDDWDKFNVFSRVDIPVSTGETLRITQNCTVDGKRFNNGEIVHVKAVEADGRMQVGKVYLPANFGHIAHGYVSTADSAQAKTVDSVLVGIGQESMGATEMRRVYVAVSRARHEARIYTDDKEALFTAASRDTVRRFGMELVGFERAKNIIQEAYGRERRQYRKAVECSHKRFLPQPRAVEREMEI